eukprot:6210666-Pleurochrysis_carterae.AAC.4
MGARACSRAPASALAGLAPWALALYVDRTLVSECERACERARYACAQASALSRARARAWVGGCVGAYARGARARDAVQRTRAQPCFVVKDDLVDLGVLRRRVRLRRASAHTQVHQGRQRGGKGGRQAVRGNIDHRRRRGAN